MKSVLTENAVKDICFTRMALQGSMLRATQRDATTCTLWAHYVPAYSAPNNTNTMICLRLSMESFAQTDANTIMAYL